MGKADTVGMLRVCAVPGCSTKTLARLCVDHDDTRQRVWPRGRPFARTEAALELFESRHQPLDVRFRVVALHRESEQRATLVLEAGHLDPVFLP